MDRPQNLPQKMALTIGNVCPQNIDFISGRVDEGAPGGRTGPFEQLIGRLLQILLINREAAIWLQIFNFLMINQINRSQKIQKAFIFLPISVYNGRIL